MIACHATAGGAAETLPAPEISGRLVGSDARVHTGSLNIQIYIQGVERASAAKRGWRQAELKAVGTKEA